MSLTLDDLRDFRDFAADKLANGGAETLQELAKFWEVSRSDQEPVAVFRLSHEDAEAGRAFSAVEVFRAARHSLADRYES